MRYQIGDFSKIARLSVKTLHFYHEAGILTPAAIDPTSGYRYYDETALATAQAITRLRELGFSIKDIKEILNTCSDDSDIISCMVRKASEINDTIAGYQQMQQRIELFLKQEAVVATMKPSQQIMIKKIPELQIASIRFKGKYAEVGKAFGELMSRYSRYINGVPFALHFDGDYKEEDADIEACVPIRKSKELPGDGHRTLPGGEALTLVYRGPYDKIGAAYKELIDFSTPKGLQILSPTREVYLKGPGTIFPRNPNHYLTELQMFPAEGADWRLDNHTSW